MIQYWYITVYNHYQRCTLALDECSVHSCSVGVSENNDSGATYAMVFQNPPGRVAAWRSFFGIVTNAKLADPCHSIESRPS